MLETRLDRLDGVGDQLFGKSGAFARCHHPPHNVAAEDVHDDVEMEVGPLDGTFYLGDVPTPDLIVLSGEKLRLS